MPIGIGAALLIGSGVSAATQLVGAKIASRASRDAANYQTAATDRASKILDDTWSPYVNKGREAISTLGRLTAAPAGSRFAAADPTQPRVPPNTAVPRGGPPTPRTPPQRVTLGGLAPGSSAPSGSPGPTGSYRPINPGPGGPPAGGMVMLEANDGSGARPVPAQMADRFLSTGNFRRVG